MEEALHDTALFRDFAGLGGWDDRVRDAMTILRCWLVLEKHTLALKVRQTINDLLRSRGLMLRAGTVVDATLSILCLLASLAALRRKMRRRTDEAQKGTAPP